MPDDKDQKISRVGTLLRWAYRQGVRPVMRDHIVAPDHPPSKGFDEAVQRVRSAAQGLEIISALTMNPTDPKALDAGIGVALRRLSGDIGT